MVSIDDMKDLVIYKRPFFLPIDPKSKTKNSLVMLLTPNYKSSINCMTAPYVINKRYFSSYYIEKDVFRYIKQESSFDDFGDYLFNINEDQIQDLDKYEYINEAKKYDNKRTISFILKKGSSILITKDEYGRYTIPTGDISIEDNPNIVTQEIGKNVLGINIIKCKMLSDTNFYDVTPNGDFQNYNYTYFVSEYSGKLNSGLKFMNIGSLVSDNISKSPQLQYVIAKYGKKIGGMDKDEYYQSKLGTSSNIVFSGYKEDIRIVSKYVTKDKLKYCFRNLELQYPDDRNIHIMCSGYSNDYGYMDNSNIVLLTPEAFKDSGYNADYSDYILYTLQLFVIHTYNPNVYDRIAEPSALILCGILGDIFDEEDSSGKHDSKYDVERVYDYIVGRYGVGELKRIIKNNDYAKVLSYAAEFYNDNYDPIFYKSFKEHSAILEEEDNITASTSDTTNDKKADMPSLNDIADFGKKLTRKIKSKSVYRLNKISRDLQRGNVGSETRGMNSLQRLQSGMNNTPQVSTPSPATPKTEATTGNINYDLQLKNALYQDRFKTTKDVLKLYNKVKMDQPWIKYAYVNLDRYTKRNLFFDLSYYNESFFRNIATNNSKEIVNPLKISKIYGELMSRLIKDDRFSNYNKKTIFIPVLDWRHNDSLRMWMYKEDVNPISIIYNILNTRGVTELVKIFGESDIIFMGAKNYFKINFKNNFSGENKQKDIVKFINLIKRLTKLGYSSPADPDPEDEPEYTPKGISMNIIDKIETSQKVEIDDVRVAYNKSNISSKISDSNVKVSGDQISPVTKNNITPNGNGQIYRDNIGKEKVTASVPTVNKSGDVKYKDKTITVTNTELKKDVSKELADKSTKIADTANKVNEPSDKDKKDEILNRVAKAANQSTDPDDAMDKLDDDDFKNMIIVISSESDENTNVDKARASRMAQLEDEFNKKEVNGKSVKDLLKDKPEDRELPKTSLKVSSINDDWKNLTFINFDKDYDPDADIVKMLKSMKDWTYPIAVRDINVKDNSTSEDVLDLWTIACEDYKGTRFTLKVDIPKFIDGDFLKLRGNEKSIMIQSTMVPVLKTGLDACQIIGIGGYNKTFVYRVGNNKGRSCPSAYRLSKAIQLYSSKKDSPMKLIPGDNTAISSKYDLPMDYIDLSRFINTIETKKYKIYFNQDEFRLQYQVNDTLGIPVGIQKGIINNSTKTKEDVVIYYTVNDKKNGIQTICDFIGSLLTSEDESFTKIYLEEVTTTGAAYSYSRCNMISEKIPMAIVLGYLKGLVPIMKRANINYRFVQKLTREDRYSINTDFIQFKDGYLIYEVNYSSSLLMNGLKKCDTESYSIRSINDKRMYLDFLSDYGGVLKSGGIDNSYDCLLDPITKEILEIYKLPTDYVGVMLHANNLLADNKFIRHTDQAGRRFRRKELIAGYFYKALSIAYQMYANQIRNTRKSVKMEMKQSAVIDLILSGDPSTNDLSVNNVINDIECNHTVTSKGLVGLNTDRAYSADKRIYDDSMLNVLGMDTGFSGNVGINRQATIDANIRGNRGFVKTINNDPNKFSTAKTLTITEAMTPFGCTHDDPPRTLMTYVQTSKHMVRCENNDPLLVTNGADEAVPYLTSDIFAFKAKKDGVIKEVVLNGKPNGRGDYMIIEYKNGGYDYISLEEEIRKNSDGGYSVPMRLYTDLKEGQSVKAGSILAYDKLSFASSLGESGNLAATCGTLAKVAIISTDENFEDSAIITQRFASKLGTDVVTEISTVVSKSSNIFLYADIGDFVHEGDTIMSIQEGSDTDDATARIMKNLSVDKDTVSELGRKPIKSHYTGTLTDVKIYRTCDLDDMSPSLRAFVNKHESVIRKKKSIYKKYGLNENLLPPTTKVEQVGKTKNVEDGVKIVFYIKYTDNMSIGDKVVFYSANKGIIKYIIQEGDEPYTDFRPDEPIDAFSSCSSVSNRLTASNILYTSVAKLMVELDRSLKDIAGIRYNVKNI